MQIPSAVCSLSFSDDSNSIITVGTKHLHVWTIIPGEAGAPATLKAQHNTTVNHRHPALTNGGYTGPGRLPGVSCGEQLLRRELWARGVRGTELCYIGLVAAVPVGGTGECGALCRHEGALASAPSVPAPEPHSPGTLLDRPPGCMPSGLAAATS